MLSKTLFLALAAVASIASAASPPACLLGAVNNYDDVSDIAGICKEKDASKQIAKVCGDKASVALSAFADVCNKVGVEVSTKIASSSGSSATGTKTGSAAIHHASATGYFNGTDSGSAQSTGAPSGTGAAPTTTTGPSGTATGTGAPIATGGAGAVEMSVGVLVAGLGFLAAAL